MRSNSSFRSTDQQLTQWMHKIGFALLRYSLAIVFIWFGILKPLGLSPAADLVSRTVYWFDAAWFVPFLGWWEVAIGLFLLFRPTVKLALLLLFIQMPGTFLPLIILPEVTFVDLPFVLSLEGQYIVKNLSLIAAAITVGGVVNRSDSKNELH